MKASNASPRKFLLFSAIATVVGSIVTAYYDRPYIDVKFGCTIGTVILESNALGVNLRSQRYQKELEHRLASLKFVATGDTHLTIFAGSPSPTVMPFLLIPPKGRSDQSLIQELSWAATSDRMVFMIQDVYSQDKSILYMCFRSYQVVEPSYKWFRWRQSWLPGMPDKTRLQSQADSYNQQAKTVIEREVLRAAKEAAQAVEKE